MWKSPPRVHGEGWGEEQGSAEEAALTPGEDPGWGQQARGREFLEGLHVKPLAALPHRRNFCRYKSRQSLPPFLFSSSKRVLLKPLRLFFNPQISSSTSKSLLKPQVLKGHCWGSPWRKKDGMRVSEQGKVCFFSYFCFRQIHKVDDI